MCLYTCLTEFFLNYVSSSHTTDRILTESPLLTASCFSYRRLSSLMHVLQGDCFWLCEIFTNVSKLLALLLLHIFFGFFLFCTLLLVVYFLISFYFFLPILLLYFCWFINHVNKSIIFLLVAFVYYFRNTISIFVPIL